MADDKKKRGGMDRALIALSEAYEVSYWSKKLKIPNSYFSRPFVICAIACLS